MSKKRFSVGQVVVRVRRGGYFKSDTIFDTRTVTKVGTKYVTVVDERGWSEQFNAKSGKGATYRGDNEINRIYESREAFEKAENEAAERQDFWRKSSAWSHREQLELIPIEDIRAAAKLLGIKLEKAR